ncbi:hypothetical protein HU200_060931 [Digitaria exilis]|uniref:Uncharacterized protein n=1 Tax=Digitaria exilis TaxID=1010633 RepID=A0A835AIE3_9POAL|nr:hypothetical protein HU200_060931 [Digitaria exilis]
MGMAAGHIVKLQLLVIVKVAALELLAVRTQGRRKIQEAAGDAMLTKRCIILRNTRWMSTSCTRVPGRKGIEFLHKELETMHAILRKVGDVPREQLDELQRIWAQDIRELF